MASGEAQARHWAMGAFFSVGLAFAIVNSLSELDERARANRPVEPWEPWTWELSSLVSFLMLAPVVFRLSQRLRPPLLSWPAAVASHLVLSLPVSLAHSAIMIALRHLIYAAHGIPYRFAGAGMASELLYEYRKDLITYAILVALPLVIGRLIEVRQAQSPSQPHRIQVRDGSHTRWILPTEVEWAQAAGNYVELFGAFGTLLHRKTLAALADELRPHGFARIHRSRIVRKAAIAGSRATSSGDFYVTLASGTTIGGSRRYRGELA